MNFRKPVRLDTAHHTFWVLFSAGSASGRHCDSTGAPHQPLHTWMGDLPGMGVALPGVAVIGTPHPAMRTILTPDALQFVAMLAR